MLSDSRRAGLKSRTAQNWNCSQRRRNIGLESTLGGAIQLLQTEPDRCQ